MTYTSGLTLLGLAAATSLAIVATSLPSWAAITVSNKNLRQGDTFEVSLVAPEQIAAADIKNTQASQDSGRLTSANASSFYRELELTFNGHSYKLFPVAAPAKAASEPAAAAFESADSSSNSLSSSASNNASNNASKSSSNSPSNSAFNSSFHGSPPVALKALIAVPADLEPGKYDLKAGNETLKLTVTAGLFPLQHIRLAPAKDNFDTAPGEEEAVEKAKSTLSEKRLWRGPFAAPSRARTSTGFGLKRVVNGRLLKDYFHSGLDFAGALGSPITACAAGKIVLVGRGFKLHGNTVAIDHGQGVVSFYIHMQKIKVKEGDEVKEGQQIGTVGQTGRATGPHLHFSIYVNKVAANPTNWFKSAF